MGHRIVEGAVTDLALVVPDYLFWFGKSIEQNFNESIWQKGFANLVVVKQSHWDAQKHNYAGKQNRMVVNLSQLDINSADYNVYSNKLADINTLSKTELAEQYAELATLFYGINLLREPAITGYITVSKEFNYTDRIDL